MSSIVTSAFLLGFVGSLHCLGMCGALALSTRRAGLRGLFSYQMGRLASYLGIGALCGAFGDLSRLWLGATAVQALFGSLLVAYGLGWLPQLPAGGLGRALVFFAPLLKRPSKSGAALLGLLTGLLPCGLLGAAYLHAATTLSAGKGALAMLAFWSATFPALWFASSLGGYFQRWGRERILAYTLIALGAVTLVRALWPGPVPMLPGCHT